MDTLLPLRPSATRRVQGIDLLAGRVRVGTTDDDGDTLADAGYIGAGEKCSDPDCGGGFGDNAHDVPQGALCVTDRVVVDEQHIIDVCLGDREDELTDAVSYTHLRAHETRHDLV